MEEGLAAALSEKPRMGAKRKLSGQEEALLVALACSSPPTGRAQWTLRLLADEFVKLEYVEQTSVSASTVGRRLAEKEMGADLLGQQKNESFQRERPRPVCGGPILGADGTVVGSASMDTGTGA